MSSKKKPAGKIAALKDGPKAAAAKVAKPAKAAKAARPVKAETPAAAARTNKVAKPIIATVGFKPDGPEKLDDPPREAIVPLVCKLLHAKATMYGAAPDKLNKLAIEDERLELKKELKLKDPVRRGLGKNYGKISASFGGAKVPPVSAENATTVKDAIHLTHVAANSKTS
ncbi:hypothetical protein OKA05_28620 [Luteolibacter arcticus]|uniref:Uncharacterized protein n=1 Tax=Luteolibacter arcticus TaxID=1581411 RepID=A0ABT3GST5_9BACT|nr:hypothetical protein [Luteolibacter arcticus]MCW1926550.1 hypothetical protein [Luteolibacter arcticus]